VHRRAFRPALGWLEPRTLLSGNPTYYTVNLTSDTGASSGTDATTGDPSGDLLWAITQANANTNTAGSVINFDPTVFGTSQTITLSNTLELSESDGPEMIQGPGSAVGTISGGNAVGVILVDGGVTASVSNLTISGGNASSGGGGIENNGSLTLSGSTVSDNTGSIRGGGIWNTGTMGITTSTIAGNTAANNANGGGIANGGLLTLTDSTVADNTAATFGGGLASSGVTVVEDSTLSANSAGTGGGGIWTLVNGSYPVSTLTIVDSTIADNQASAYGGGIYSQAPLTLVNSTIAYNTTSEGGDGAGIEIGGSGNATLNNTIVVANTQGTTLFAYDDDLAGGPGDFTGSNNLVGNDRTGTLSSSDNLLGVTNPGIGLLGNNGGPTQTIALYAGSPAINAGSVALAVDPTTNQPLAYDQRGIGFPRTISGTVDIGAFERPTVIGSPTIYTVNLTSANGTGSGNSGDLVYVIGQADANPNLAGSIVQFDPTVFATPQTITLSATLELSEPSGPLLINGPGASVVTISGNNAVNVFQVDNGEVATLSGLTISAGLDRASRGGGIIALNFSTLTVSHSTLSGNASTSDGGGIASAGNLTLVDSTLSDNTANGNNGGGLFNLGTATITGSLFTGGTASEGGGIFNDGTLSLSGSTLTGNTASNNGGGLWISGTAVIEDSTAADNVANGGGGLYNQATLTVVNSTIADNQAGAYGGGIWNNGGGLTVVSSTIAYNSTSTGGGIRDENGAAATLDNTIVVENGGADLAGSGVFATSASNLVGYDQTGSLSGSDNLLGVTDPGIGLLASNGGPTQTIALLAGSPAINGGSNAFAVDPTTNQPLAYDQRGIGFPRTVAGMVDIGAYEGPDPTTTTIATSVTPSVYGQSVTFTATVTAKPPLSGMAITPTGTVTFYDGPKNLGTGTLNALGVASYMTTAFQLSVGSNQSITAVYSGDANYNTSTSNVLPQTVNKDGTTTIVGASPSSANLGQTVTLTATVTANSPGSGTPTGTVDFYDTTTSTDLTPGDVPLSGGTVSYSTTSLAAGPHTIKASYSGDTNFVMSYGIAGTVTVGQSIIVLDPSAGGALSISGNASINLPGGVYVNSSSSNALSASGNAAIKATVIDVHGGVSKSGNASFSPAPAIGAAVAADPYASLMELSTTGLCNYGAISLSGSSSKSICQGIYSGISLSGNATLTMGSGIYIIEGGGFSISGNASLSGSGVTIFNAGSKYPTTGGTYGSISLSGNGSYSLTPPTGGTYAGVVIFQPRDNTKALTISGNASGMTGVIYAPAAQLSESGNAQLNASIDVDTLSISGNGVANTITLTSPSGTVAYAPNQIRDAYGINALSGLDGTGQTIAIVDAYDDPDIFQALDTFDAQFGLTDSGPTLYQQYGPASSFLTVLNQYGQATSLPSTDPNGPGTDNWEVEEALDVEWTHAIAPGAQIVLVEANSQSLSDLMATVATAAAQSGVSVVSMSWGFPEGQAVFAADEATYDRYFNVPGVTFVASTGDYGAADPEYPAYSPDVVAVGGTSLTVNSDNSYNSETGWGYYSSAAGTVIASGGGISLYEPEPAYQQGMQSTGYRTTPDVSLVADPATGAWIADPYNLDPSNPFEVVGGTSLSAPAWAGLIALANQGRVAAGESTLNNSTPTDAQQALYMLPQADYNGIASGNNGYSANAGYNLVTGLGTPLANLLVPDLVAYRGAGTTYNGPTVAPLQSAGLVNNGTTNGGPMDVLSVFDSLTVPGDGFGFARDISNGASINGRFDLMASGAAGRAQPAGIFNQSGQALGLNPASNSSAVALFVSLSAGRAGTPNSAVVTSAQVPQSANQPVMYFGAKEFRQGERASVPRRNPARTEPRPPGMGKYDLARVGVPDELAAEIALVRVQRPRDNRGTGYVPLTGAQTGPMRVAATEWSPYLAGRKPWLADILLAIGFCGYGAATLAAPGLRTTYFDRKRKPFKIKRSALS
jgi:hypothetical protein